MAAPEAQGDVIVHSCVGLRWEVQRCWEVHHGRQIYCEVRRVKIIGRGVDGRVANGGAVRGRDGLVVESEARANAAAEVEQEQGHHRRSEGHGGRLRLPWKSHVTHRSRPLDVTLVGGMWLTTP